MRSRARWLRATVGGDPVLRRMLSNSGWLLSADGIAILVGLAQGVLITRALGAGGYGILGIIVAFVTLVSRLTSFRMNEVIVKYLSNALSLRRGKQAAAAIRGAALVEVAASAVAFVLVWALAPLGARFFVQTPEAAELIRLYALIVLGTMGSETATGVLQVFDRFRVQSLVASAQQGVALLGIGVALLWDAGLSGVLLAYVVSGGLAALALLVVAWQETVCRLGTGWWRGPSRRIPGGWRRALSFSLNTNFSSTLSLIAKEGDLLWLGYFRPASEVGLYRLAISLAGTLVRPLSPLVHTIYPEVARHTARREWSAFRRLLEKTSVLAGAYLLPVTAATVLLAVPVIRWVYGAEFMAAAPALWVLLLGMGFSHLFLWARPALLALHRADYAMKVSTVVVVLKVTGMALLVPRFGYLGVAALTAAALCAGVAVCVGKVASELARQPRPALVPATAATR